MRKTGYDDAYKELRESLIRARRDAGWSQEKLAAKLGRAQTFVSKIELGERRLDLIEMLVWGDALRVDVHEIVDRLQKKIGSARHFKGRR
jgi:ribosome-binding protein aMBF1 (putative translation factor)